MQMYHDFVLAMFWEYAVFVPLISQLTRFLTALQTIFENTIL